eukprot:m.71421 g.71421  ORF g.71421 m.71421 type:complete len:100 (+) comp14174_c1_seq1:1152-1451(+)
MAGQGDDKGDNALPTTLSVHSRHGNSNPVNVPGADCLECRLTGAAAFSAVAVYLLYERSRLPPNQRNRFFLGACSTMMFGFAAARLLYTNEAPSDDGQR